MRNTISFLFLVVLLLSGCATAHYCGGTGSFSVTYNVVANVLRLCVVNHTGEPVLVRALPKHVELTYSREVNGEIIAVDNKIILLPPCPPQYSFLPNVSDERVGLSPNEFVVMDIDLNKHFIRNLDINFTKSDVGDWSTNTPKVVQVMLSYCPIKELGDQRNWFEKFDWIEVDASAQSTNGQSEIAD